MRHQRRPALDLERAHPSSETKQRAIDMQDGFGPCPRGWRAAGGLGFVRYDGFRVHRRSNGYVLCYPDHEHGPHKLVMRVGVRTFAAECMAEIGPLQWTDDPRPAWLPVGDGAPPMNRWVVLRWPDGQLRAVRWTTWHLTYRDRWAVRDWRLATRAEARQLPGVSDA